MTLTRKKMGGARPGAGRPKVRRILELTHDQACMLVAALECYSNESYSTAEDYDARPLEELRALVDELATMGPPLPVGPPPTLLQAQELMKLSNGKGLIEVNADDFEATLERLRPIENVPPES